MSEALAQELNAKLSPLPWPERLRALRAYSHLRIAFSTSFSVEDQAITHVIADEHLPIRLFTLDTGRLFEETHRTHQQSRERYGIPIETYYPDAGAIQQFVTERGINSIYASVQNRKTCCHIRKVEPLSRALQNTDVWISGVRREHSESRGELPFGLWDAGRNIVALYPLADAAFESVMAFVKAHDVPYNPMHEQGFPSIGCAPCTRAIAPGEPIRAGRWWWEEDQKECGLHVQDGKVMRLSGDIHAG